MKNSKIFHILLDIIVTFGRLLRRIEGESPFTGWNEVLLIYIPQTFFFYWLFSLIPAVGRLAPGSISSKIK